MAREKSLCEVADACGDVIYHKQELASVKAANAALCHVLDERNAELERARVYGIKCTLFAVAAGLGAIAGWAAAFGRRL